MDEYSWHPSFSLKPGRFLPPAQPAESSFNFLFNYNLEPLPTPGMEARQMSMSMAAESCKSKKRLTSEQVESLENSFQEEVKLDPDRKARLSRDLGLQQRQVAVWFQNRRARWKAKQLERLYDSLKLQFDAVSRERRTLQDEVLRLRALLNHPHNQVSAGDQTVDSVPECHYLFTSAAALDDDYTNTVASPPPPYWPPLPTSYPC